MLGWPSPTYPNLLKSGAPIRISYDQSAMIAGFLMIGNILGTPFSTWYLLGTKFGITIGLFLMLLGWLVMWHATNIYFLLGSRLLIGIGFGYSIGSLKAYIKDICQSNLTPIFLQLPTFFVYFGVILANVVGCFLSFANFSLFSTCLTGIILVVTFLLPHSPKEYLKFGKEKHAKLMLNYLKPEVDVENELEIMKIDVNFKTKNLSFTQVLRDPFLRKQFALLGMLTFFQQFTGAPSTIVYTQIIFDASDSSHSQYCAMAYSVLFFLSNLIGVFYSKQFNRKCCLLYSTVGTIFSLLLNIFVFYYNINDRYWSLTSFVSMSIFIFFHSTGLAVVPFMLTKEYFPLNARDVVSKFQVVQHSALALIITKIFQVLLFTFDLYVPFCLFLCVAVICLIFIISFVPSEVELDEYSKKSTIQL